MELKALECVDSRFRCREKAVKTQQDPWYFLAVSDCQLSMAFKDRLFALLFTCMIIYASTLDRASAADSIQGCGGFVEVCLISSLILSITSAFLSLVVINFFEIGNCFIIYLLIVK